ncbi:guanylin-like isoform X2 [Alosa alosa]|uniref:guanylin-like isoform X2 n=1 Tax=Alosa sapidissima TaxID=34773 RepID=UPI001C08B175|nr:guanylin-like isoform X2 [Alosa sapidissima]XP_048096264.1 guanylin-like isoform X2 [Alosa alosa]
MKTFIPFALVLMAFYQPAENVIVKEGGFSFPLEVVKKLKDFLDQEPAVKQKSRIGLINTATMCNSPGFPEEFKPLCQSKDAKASLTRLGC